MSGNRVRTLKCVKTPSGKGELCVDVSDPKSEYWQGCLAQAAKSDWWKEYLKYTDRPMSYFVCPSQPSATGPQDERDLWNLNVLGALGNTEFSSSDPQGHPFRVIVSSRTEDMTRPNQQARFSVENPSQTTTPLISKKSVALLLTRCTQRVMSADQVFQLMSIRAPIETHFPCVEKLKITLQPFVNLAAKNATDPGSNETWLKELADFRRSHRYLIPSMWFYEPNAQGEILAEASVVGYNEGDVRGKELRSGKVKVGLQDERRNPLELVEDVRRENSFAAGQECFTSSQGHRLCVDPSLSATRSDYWRKCLAQHADNLPQVLQTGVIDCGHGSSREVWDLPQRGWSVHTDQVAPGASYQVKVSPSSSSNGQQGEQLQIKWPSGVVISSAAADRNSAGERDIVGSNLNYCMADRFTDQERNFLSRTGQAPVRMDFSGKRCMPVIMEVAQPFAKDGDHQKWIQTQDTFRRENPTANIRPTIDIAGFADEPRVVSPSLFFIDDAKKWRSVRADRAPYTLIWQ